jgi:hypothetical protein
VDDDIIRALATIALVGAFGGLLGGWFGSGKKLIGSILLGIIGGISAAAIARIARFPGALNVGDGFSLLWGGGGGLLLGYVVGRSTR